mmetsp:Transcript_26026/g.56774  ORF Transcript_26026/g.56774 Transcript_26026/m.56774 type:complete len:323 (-) Transcript_26026:763-1731(-)
MLNEVLYRAPQHFRSRCPGALVKQPKVQRCPVLVRANQHQESDSTLQQRQKDQLIIAASAVGLTTLASLCLTVWRDPIEDVLLSDALGGSGSGFGIGDAVGGLLWGASLYFATPLQLLLLFLGKIDTERPSDWLLRTLGVAAGLPVDDLGYSAPAAVRAATIAICLAGGLGIAGVLNAGLGDATWSVSTGIGVCMAAGVYEVGRPARLSVTEAQTLEDQWQDFANFADARLQKAGRCHESEVFGAFRKEFAKYRREEVISDAVLRDMVRNWHPDVERTPRGFYKNMSVVARRDPFTGETVGQPRPAAVQVQVQAAQQQEQQV